jgi:hypothetical protein
MFDDFPVSELPPADAAPKAQGIKGDGLRLNPDHVQVDGYIQSCPSCAGSGRFIKGGR